MPRFIVHLRDQRTYNHWLSRPIATTSHDQLINEAISLPKPAPFVSDGWKITSIGEIEVQLPPGKLKDGNWGLRARCPVTAEGAVVIHAKHEKAARQYVEQHVIDGYYYEGVDDSCVPHWYGYRYQGLCEIASIHTETQVPRLRRSFTIPVDVLACDDRSWYPYEVDQAFEAFRWMVATGKPYEQKCTWHTQTMNHVFSGRRDCDPFGFGYDVRPILSLRDLKSRFQHTLLSQSYGFYQRWRDDKGFQLGSTLRIEAAHYGKNWRQVVDGPDHWHDRQSFTFDRMIQNLTEDLSGMKMTHSLNTSHPGASVIQHAGIAVYPDGFSFVICYGYPNDGSSWSYVLARTRGNEPFVETANRAYNTMRRLIPDFREQIETKRELSWKLRGLRDDELTRLAVKYRDRLSSILSELPKANADALLIAPAS